jgi:hypothetical protein
MLLGVLEVSVMGTREYDRVCYRTEQREESIRLRNLRSGAIGYSFGCTASGTTVQVRLNNGEMDSWGREDCIETD